MRAKERVIEALRADARLKKVSVSSAWHDAKKKEPQITVSQVISRPAVWSDDTPDFDLARIQIDVWHEGNPFAVAEVVREVLEEAGMFAEGERELNEADINRVILEYTVIE
jgi:protein-disulfide isomerase-like protein with CxxC motif